MRSCEIEVCSLEGVSVPIPGDKRWWVKMVCQGGIGSWCLWGGGISGRMRSMMVVR